MTVFPSLGPFSRRVATALASLVVLALAIDRALAIPLPGEAGSPGQLAALAPTHLVVSEVMTGGASASDEFIELYNPSDAALPLEGLEVVYVTASGATVTRKAAWSPGAPSVAPGGHLLIANEAGIFAPLADVQYANGLAAGGGSVALRVQGAATAIDAVGWGTTASTWLEPRAAPAPPAGSSLERLPGGSSGSTQDTDANLVDFVVQPLPDPQNSSSPPVLPPGASTTPSPTANASESTSADPSATPSDSASPVPSESPDPTPIETLVPTAVPTASPAATSTLAPTVTPEPTATPAPTPISIATARSMADGTSVTVEGVTLSASDFAEGGGYLVDAGGAIAVLLSDGTFPRGVLLRVTGTVDDRFAQRTIRSDATAILVGSPAAEPLPTEIASGEVGESFEGGLVQLSGTIDSAPSALSGGIAFDLDDGSGATRILVGSSTGIDTSAWARGAEISLIGVVGQRDSSGTGTAGYRVQPRDPNDILALEPPPTPTPTPTPAPTATPGPTAAPTATPGASASPIPSATPAGTGLVTISEARAAKVGSRVRIRGVVTAPSGLLEAGSAVAQDSTGAVLVRLGSRAGSLALGQMVELDGTRSTKAGMLSLRITTPAVRLGTQADPEPLRRGTGALGEAQEARLVIIRGAVSGAVSRPRGGAVSFSLDDGSGPIRVSISPLARIASGAVVGGAWLEIRGVLGQHTTGREPLRNYRLWPRTAADLRVIAAPVAGSAGVPCCTAVEQAPDAGAPDGEPVGNGVPTSAGPQAVPVLVRPHPTDPSAAITPTSAAQSDVSSEESDRGAGLVVSGMGLAALAALLAWSGRRGRWGIGVADGDPDPALVRTDVADSPEERRILPPI